MRVTLLLLSLLLGPLAEGRDFVIDANDADALNAAIVNANQVRGRDRVILTDGGNYAFQRAWKEGADTALPPISDDLVLIGNGSHLRVYASEPLSLLLVEPDVSVRIVETNFRDGQRGAVENLGELRLERCRFEDNSTASGAAAILNYGRLHDQDSVVAYNTASGLQQAGGAILNHGEMTLSGTRLAENRAFGDGPWAIVGAALVNLGQAELRRVQIISNHGDDGRYGAGAVANLHPGAMVMKQTVLEDNRPAGLARVDQEGAIRFAESHINP